MPEYYWRVGPRAASSAGVKDDTKFWTLARQQHREVGILPCRGHHKRGLQAVCHTVSLAETSSVSKGPFPLWNRFTAVVFREKLISAEDFCARITDSNSVMPRT